VTLVPLKPNDLATVERINAAWTKYVQKRGKD
jgi:hypothetical protein